jgi:P-type Ca2+ transporter type 2C
MPCLLLTKPSNRRLDNKLNIFEGIQRNYFFIIMNLIMVGGQVMIIYVGGQAFKVVPQNGKEWGMAVGLGAISIPWGAALRLTPDSVIEMLLPKFVTKRWKEQPAPTTPKPESDSESEGYATPLRTLSTIRGPRSVAYSGFRGKMRGAKDKAKGKIKDTKHGLHEKMNGNGSKQAV